MAANLPKDIVKLFELRDTTGPLYKFLQDMLNRTERLEKEVEALKKQVAGGP